MLRSNLSQAGGVERRRETNPVLAKDDSLDQGFNGSQDAIHHVRRVLIPTEFKTITTKTASKPMNRGKENHEASNDLTDEASQPTAERFSSYLAATKSPSSSPTMFPTYSPTTFPPFPSSSPSNAPEVSSDLESESSKDPDPISNPQTRFLGEESSSCETFGHKRKCKKTSGCSWTRGSCVAIPSTTKCAQWNHKRQKCRHKGCDWNVNKHTCTGVDFLLIEESSVSSLAQTRPPSQSPTDIPTATPSWFPTYSPTTLYPTTSQDEDSTEDTVPSFSPTYAPTTFPPTLSSSASPTDSANGSPTFAPTTFPLVHSDYPTYSPTTFPPAPSSSPTSISGVAKFSEENDSLVI